MFLYIKAADGAPAAFSACLTMSVQGKKITQLGCIKVLNAMIVMRVVGQASRSHTHLLKYTGDAEKHAAIGTKIIATLSVFDFLELVCKYNRADIFSQVPPVGKRRQYTREIHLQPWKLVLCIEDGPNDLFKVFEDDFLMCNIPASCCDALVIFTDAQSLQNTLNVVHGPTLPCFFRSFKEVPEAYNLGAPNGPTNTSCGQTAAPPLQQVEIQHTRVRNDHVAKTNARDGPCVNVLWLPPRSDNHLANRGQKGGRAPSTP